MVQVPTVTKLNKPPLVMVQTLGVDEVKVGAKPESDVAVKVGEVPKFCDPGLRKVSVWIALGVIGLDALEAGPKPTAFSASTVKV